MKIELSSKLIKKAQMCLKYFKNNACKTLSMYTLALCTAPMASERHLPHTLLILVFKAVGLKLFFDNLFKFHLKRNSFKTHFTAVKPASFERKKHTNPKTVFLG